MKLEEVKKELEKYYVIVDPYVIEVIMATIVGNMIIDRDPLWTMLIASSSGGKSSLMAPVAGIPSTHFIDDLTEKTFLSGFKMGGKEVSLLKLMGKKAMMCFSDFTSIMSKNPVTKTEILSQFRLIFDGNFTKRTGTGEISWQGKMGFLGASTPDVYFQLETARSMGERFLYYTIDQPTDQQIVEKQEEVQLSSKDIADALKPIYHEYMMAVRDFAVEENIELKLDADQMYRVNQAAIFCVSGKTSIHTDFKTGRPDAMPNRPGVGRDRKMFQTMLHALQVMHCYEKGDSKLSVQDEHITIIEKCAYSSIGRERRKILEILCSTKHSLTSTQIGATDNFGLQREAVDKYIAPLFAVGLVKRDTTGKAFKWFIDDEGTRAFVQRVAGAKNIDIAEDDDTLADEEFAKW